MSKAPDAGLRTEHLGTRVAQLTSCSLRGVTPGIEPAVVPLGLGALSVGQSEANAMRVADATVSRFHFEIGRAPEGILLRDLGSTNGTLVEGVWVREARLRPGQRIDAGRAQFVFEQGDGKRPVASHADDHFGQLVGGSEPMRLLFAQLAKAASSDATVLLLGESGTGKELVAEELHRHSARRDGPFVVVDCGSLPEQLMESELFGHEKGAFTGAAVERPGAFEAADGGTLFLDEIGELPLAMQPKLLRALEARTVRRVGSNKNRPVDVRYVAATNRNLRSEVNAGSFREDLFWRLCVVELRIPPLRERRDDMAALVAALWQRSAAGRASQPQPPAGLVEQLSGLPWRGNVRELRNVVERAAIFGAVETTALDAGVATAVPKASLPTSTMGLRTDLPYGEAKCLWTELFEREYLRARLDAVAGNQSQLARDAQMDRAFLLKLLRKHGLR